MKISQFCKLFDITPGAVRFYIEKGLLIPAVVHGRYYFSEKDMADMRLLRRLKACRFSIPEIHHLMSLFRYSDLLFAREAEDYIRLLTEKKEALLAEQQQLEEALANLAAEETAAIAARNRQPLRHSGVPARFLPYLACPSCQAGLVMQDCHIECEEILSARLYCSKGCGYHAEIRDGILLAPQKEYSLAEAREELCFYHAMSPEMTDGNWLMNADLITLLYKCYQWLFDRLPRQPQREMLVLEDYINGMCFTHSRLAQLPENALYILTDPYPMVLRMYRDILNRTQAKRSVLFIAAENDNLPLRRQCVDIYIDLAANKHAMRHHAFALDAIAKYLRPNALALGGFWSFRPNGVSAATLQQKFPACWRRNFDLSFFRHTLNQRWQQIKAWETIAELPAPVVKNSDAFLQPGEAVMLSAYAATGLLA